MKVLIFVILLSTLNFIKFAKSLNLTYILKQKHDHFEPNCIAEEDLLDSPIGWIYPFPKNKTDVPQITSRFLPEIPNNYSCNFENDNLCSHTWLLSTEKWSLKTDFGLILDTRWEAFPTLLTTNKTEKEYYEVMHSNFNFGFSVRSSGNVEVLLCEGWNPNSYPCYCISMGNEENRVVSLRKIGVKDEFGKKGEKLDSYKYYTKNILFEDEWRNFEIIYNGLGRISLLEVFTGKTIINYTDPEPLNLLYVLPRSKNLALWKMHKNQFLYTEQTKISKLGMEIETPSNDLCVSLYASLCENCSMKFTIKDANETKGSETILGKKSDLKWRHVKFFAENIISDFVDLYVETKFDGDDNPFWGIDDVRICNAKEIKISTLFYNKQLITSDSVEDISCQSVLHQKWRPIKHVQPSLPVFPAIETLSSNSTIELLWMPSTSIVPNLSYMIHFWGEDVCPEKTNKNRLKSSGYIITKDHKVTIDNLVPYTHYNIEFSYILEDKTKTKSESTLPTDTPTKEEIPKNVTIEASESNVILHWEKPKCEHIYGPLWYLIKLTNEKTNYHNELESAEMRFQFQNLQPFTEYEVEIIVARTREYDYNFSKRIYYNFRTSPTIAPPVRNLEVYSIDLQEISLRFDMPFNPQGIPKFVQASYYDKLLNSRPRAIVGEIKNCKLWPEKYCLDLKDLIAHRLMKVSVSLKNAGTHMFGKETAVEVFTTHDRIPGKPSNVTYRVVDCYPDNDYCHLNISWLHPYQQNTTITSFNINLNRTVSNKISSHITELLKIYNSSYQPVYHLQIKYIPYSTHYLLSVQSVHDEFKSDFETIHVRTDDIGDHIDQAPKLKDITNSTLIFQVAKLDSRLNATILTTVVQDYNESKKLNRDLLGLELHEDNFCNSFGDTWIANVIQLKNEPQDLIIGDGTTKYLSELKHYVVNKPLLPNTRYCLTFIVRNKYEETEHEVVYYEKDIITDEVKNEQLIQPPNTYVHLYILFVMLLFIPLGFLLYRYIQKKKAAKKRNQNSEENVYESLPFEECDNCVYNNTYDKLMHS